MRSIYYDVSAMNETCNQLNEIIEQGISWQTTQQFCRTAIQLKWEGEVANIFRNMVYNLLNMVEYANSQDIVRLQKNIVIYLSNCAMDMKKTG